MIYLITGAPGEGKTLYTITFVKELSERENRQVYYSGIADLKLPWIELDDPTQWHTLPAGSIVVIDEAQRIFRPRGNGSAVPEHVAQLETHRHKGIDIFVVTQHPMLIDSNVRRLVGTHWHVMRTFGMQRATIHEFKGVAEQCDKSRTAAVARHEWGYPKDIFSLYKSAEVHTHKARIPKRVWFLLAMPLLLGACIWMFWTWATRSAPSQDPAPGQLATGQISTASSSSSRVAPLTKAEYLEMRTPRLPGLAYTAPAYDEVTRPVRAPYPAACVVMRNDCRCYSQQATRLDMPDQLCRSIVERGFFHDWQEERGDDRHQVQQPQPSLSTRNEGPRYAYVFGADGRGGVREVGTRPGGSAAIAAEDPPGWGGEREPSAAEEPRKPQVPLDSPAHFNNRNS